VALVITTIGFFASLKFYRDGVDLQARANDALTKLEEKTQNIQTQIHSIVDKVIKALIKRSEPESRAGSLPIMTAAMAESFSNLTKEIEELKKFIDDTLKQIGAAGQQEQNRLMQDLEKKVESIQAVVETTKENVQDSIPITLLANEILNVLCQMKTGLTVAEIASRLNKAKLQVRYTILKLHSHGLVVRIPESRPSVYFAHRSVGELIDMN
jgi:peptidoglycan hydrolase CwlO-like protein